MVKKRTTASETKSKNDPERYKRLADYLQQARRNRRVSVRKVAQISSLPESTIRALENPRRSTLPSSNVVGLYKVYASALDVPASRVTKMVGADPDAKPDFRVNRLPKLKSLVVFSNISATVAVVAVLAVVLTYVAWQSFGLVSQPDLTITYPDQEFIIVDESSIEIAGSADRESTVLINGQPTVVRADSGSFSQIVFLQTGYNYITVEVVNSFSTTTTKNYVIIFQPKTIQA